MMTHRMCVCVRASHPGSSVLDDVVHKGLDYVLQTVGLVLTTWGRLVDSLAFVTIHTSNRCFRRRVCVCVCVFYVYPKGRKESS